MKVVKKIELSQLPHYGKTRLGQLKASVGAVVPLVPAVSQFLTYEWASIF